jgi:hypothetical protein
MQVFCMTGTKHKESDAEPRSKQNGGTDDMKRFDNRVRIHL